MITRSAIRNFLKLVLVLACFPLSFAGQTRVVCIGPLSEERLTDLVRNVPEMRVIEFITTCSLAFSVDSAAEARLKRAGATDAILNTARERARRAEAERRKAQRETQMKQLKFEFVPILPGEFMMGCSTDDSQCDEDEKPAHRVRITRGFQIGKYEVTQGMWEFVMGNNPSGFKAQDRPVEQVSWFDVQAFLAKLNQEGDGYLYRLPTEAEWEYCARAGMTQTSTAELTRTAWYGQSGGTQPVGQRDPNAWGLHDMLGNVWEWVEDWYSERYYESSANADPRGPAKDLFRSLRSGSWMNLPKNVRLSTRVGDDPEARSRTVGFRAVRETASR